MCHTAIFGSIDYLGEETEEEGLARPRRRMEMGATVNMKEVMPAEMEEEGLLEKEVC